MFIPISITNLIGTLQNCMNSHICKKKTIIQTYLCRIHRKHFFLVDYKGWSGGKRVQDFAAFVCL